MVPSMCAIRLNAHPINTADKHLRMWEHYNNQMACFQAVRANLSHKSRIQPHKPTSRKVTVFKKRITFFGRDQNKMEIDRMLYLLKSFVFVSLKFSFSILLFSLPISVNFSIFFHLFCEIAVFSYVFERELARESPKLIPSCMANI